MRINSMLLIWVICLALGPGVVNAAPLQICVTVPELGSLVRTIGGDDVEVRTFAKGTEDAHFVEAKPSFIKALSKADMFVQAGLDLEVGWVPVLLQNARNAAVLPGGIGFVDASAAVKPLDVANGSVDRSMGDVHVHGNPHYLLDPVNGWRVASLLRDALIRLHPEGRVGFESRFLSFERSLAELLVGERLVSGLGAAEVLSALDRGQLAGELREGDVLGGWMAQMEPLRGTRVAVDHGLWRYFLARFGLEQGGSLEPKPGVEPSTKHLEQFIAQILREEIPLFLATSYYDPRHAKFVADRTGIKIVEMAHQVGSRPGTEEYLQMLEFNVRAIVQGIKYVQP